MMLKQIKRITGLLALASFAFFSSCDKISEDDMREKVDGLPTWNGQYVVLEEFTGVKCVNCPAAAEVANSLKKTFGDKLIVIGLHPQGITFTTPFGSEKTIIDSATGQTLVINQALGSLPAKDYLDYFKEEALPKGMINRGQNPGQCLNPDAWYSKVLEEYTKMPVASLTLDANVADGRMNISVKGFFDQKYNGGEIKLITMILEDSLVVTQQVPSGLNFAYVQNHVLRTTAGPSWGETVWGGTVSQGTSISKEYVVDLDPKWRADKLAVVCMLTDGTSRKIIQAAQVSFGGGH